MHNQNTCSISALTKITVLFRIGGVVVVVVVGGGGGGGGGEGVLAAALIKRIKSVSYKSGQLRFQFVEVQMTRGHITSDWSIGGQYGGVFVIAL